ncbi:hypothetical protein MMC24_007032 [Lignoscripta atroalba]|nr:hypothetical protein [Lignoscripta atroalba]
MNPSEAAPCEPFAHVFLKPAPPASASTASQSQLQSQSRTSSSPRRSHSEASRRRKRDDGSAFSSATTEFAASTREKTKALLHGQCFHCEMSGPYAPLDVCHVIPKKSSNYDRHLADGLLDFSLDDIVNSILLCKNCHVVFDDLEPVWTFLPTDLEYFIHFEEEDFKRRQAIVDERYLEQQQLQIVPPPLPLPPPPRRCPTAGEYLEAWVSKEPKWPSSALGGAYSRFTMPRYRQRPDTMHLQAWHGAPLAAIIHAFRAVLGNLTPPEFVAPSIKKQLRKLQDLYERRPETGHGGDTSINLEERFVANTRTPASANAPSLTLGPNMPSLPPAQLSSSSRDPLTEQVEMQEHDTQQQPTEFAEAVSPTILDQPVVAIEASSEQPIKKRRRTSSSPASLPQHRARGRSPPPPTPALTRKASTNSPHASPGLQPHLPVTHNVGGEVGGEPGEDPFSHVFRYNWQWGPQSSTQEKVERFLSLSPEEDTHLLD